jgi:hypothetical protein
MNVIDAAYSTVHDYPGGSIALAPRLNMSAAILRGKVNPNDAGHHLTLAEATRMQALSGDYRIVMAMADELGCTVLRLPAVDDHDLLAATLAVVRSFGAMMGDVESSLADGRVSINELRGIERTMLECLGHVSALHRQLAHRAGV